MWNPKQVEPNQISYRSPTIVFKNLQPKKYE